MAVDYSQPHSSTSACFLFCSSVKLSQGHSLCFIELGPGYSRWLWGRRLRCAVQCGPSPAVSQSLLCPGWHQLRQGFELHLMVLMLPLNTKPRNNNGKCHHLLPSFITLKNYFKIQAFLGKKKKQNPKL